MDYNTLLKVISGLVFFGIAGFSIYTLLTIARPRIKESTYKLPDLDEVYKKPTWNVKTVSKVKITKKPTVATELISKEEEEVDLMEQFEEIFEFKKKIVLKKLPSNLYELSEEEEDSEGNIKTNRRILSQDDEDFEDILNDLEASIDSEYTEKTYTKKTTKKKSLSPLDKLLEKEIKNAE